MATETGPVATRNWPSGNKELAQCQQETGPVAKEAGTVEALFPDHPYQRVMTLDQGLVYLQIQREWCVKIWSQKSGGLFIR